jgi:hypothetical protein
MGKRTCLRLRVQKRQPCGLAFGGPGSACQRLKIQRRTVTTIDITMQVTIGK